MLSPSELGFPAKFAEFRQAQNEAFSYGLTSERKFTAFGAPPVPSTFGNFPPYMVRSAVRKPNVVLHRPDGISEIRLTHGKIALVDTVDYCLIQHIRWHADKGKRDTWYAAGPLKDPKSRSGYKNVKMHRLVLGLTSKMIWGDHKDGNGLNNCRYNLRAATPSQNAFNTVGYGANFPGVNYHSRDQKWQCRITVNGKRFSLGYFDSEEEANQARLDGEKKYNPDFERCAV